MRTTMVAPATATGATSERRLVRLALSPLPRRSGLSGSLCRLTVVAGGFAVAASAVIHLHLWLLGYRHIHLIGAAFLAQAVSGLLLAAALIMVPRLAVLLCGAAFCAGSVVALLLSSTVGFLGLHDGLDVPWAGWSLGVELAGFLLLAATALDSFRSR